MLLIAGDIGGTKTILRLVEVLQHQHSSPAIYEAQYPSSEYPDLVPMVKHFLASIGDGVYSPDLACFAIAGPVINQTCHLTNLNWFLESQRLEKDLQIPKVNLINDFAAVSYGVIGLENSAIDSLQTGIPQSNTPIAVIGAGTGLGESFLISNHGDYQVFATEGGHADFAPRSEIEFQLLEYLKQKYKIDRVSVERVVSGQGIVSIYQFLRDVRPIASESDSIGTKIRRWEKGDSNIDPGAIISQAALDRQDPLCERTMQIFTEAYGAEAGNFALKLLPYGGLYIAGGIAAKILPLMKDGRFICAFNQKGRMSDVLHKIPVRLVLNPQVGLLGSIIFSTDRHRRSKLTSTVATN
jgi:glucokinase